MNKASWSKVRALGAGLALLAGATGCVTTGSTERAASTKGTRDLPLARTFWHIHGQHYREGRNDCSNKAGQYARALNKKGYEAKVVVVEPKGHKRVPTLHAIVEVDGKLFADPTAGKWSEELADFGEYRFALPVQALGSWGREFM